MNREKGMPLSTLSTIPDGAWFALSAIAGSAVTLLLGWLNLARSRDTGLAKGQQELSQGQRELIAILRNEVDSLHLQVDGITHALISERQSCEQKMQVLADSHQGQIDDLKRRMGCNEDA